MNPCSLFHFPCIARLTRALGAFFLLLALTVGVSVDGQTAVTGPPLMVGQEAEPKSLDPHVTTSLNDFRILVNVYEGLVRFKDGTLDPEPALARAWRVSADGRVYTFELQKGVTFHDGAPFDAAAVRYNFARMRDPSHPEHAAGPFPLAFFFDVIDRIETPDPLIVRFHLKRPFAPFLANLAYPVGLMVSPRAARRYGKEYGRHPAGTGPFRVQEWTSRRHVVLVPNPDYRRGAPCQNRIIFRPVTDPMTRVAELLSGGLDLAFGVEPDNIDHLRGDSRFRVHEAVGPHLWFLIFNTRFGPLRDLRVRQAVNHALDKEALVRDLLQGTAVVAAGPVAEAFSWAHDPDLKPYPHDPERARALLKEAGVVEGTPLTLLAPRGGSGMLAPMAMAAAIQGDLARVGLKVKIESFEWNAYLARVNAGLDATADMAEMAWMTNDPDTLFYLALRSEATPDKGGFNSGWYQNPDVDQRIRAARTEMDRDRRAERYRALQRLIHDDAPWGFVASWRQNVVARATVQGLKLQPSFFLLLDSVDNGGPACNQRSGPKE